MKLRIFIYVVFLLIIISCKKDRDEENDKAVFDSKNNTSVTNNSVSSEYKLEISYKKLEVFLSKGFIPISSLKTNIDNDADEEFVITYKKDNNSKIFFCVFDLIKSEILKKRFEFETEIYHNEGFLIQTQNLFLKNNTGIIVEGKSFENIYHLYIILFNQDDYKIIGNFKGDFSIVVDYEDVDDEKGKFTRIKNVITISNAASSVNSNVQRKDIYTWDEKDFAFKLIKSEEFLSSSNTFIDSNILYSEINYFNYLKGIWYPEKYKNIIQDNSLNKNEFSESNIRNIFLSNAPNEIGIKYGDYVDKYIIVKIVKLWNQKPGLRLILKEFNNPNEVNFTKSIDLTLLESNLLKVQGPERFDDENYVRLSKSFVDYVNEKKDDLNKSKVKEVEMFLNEKFKLKDDITIEFTTDKKFKLKKDKIINKGIYQINKDKEDLIILFLFEGENNILKKTNFLIKIYKDKNYFTLIPVRFDFNKITLEELSSMDFYKIEK
ncbi:MAG TPA: hypothetical protein PK771_00350 [Spirochaetota bacterium]|nr:hypothetical protein [Spirochaetota bacterium]